MGTPLTLKAFPMLTTGIFSTLMAMHACIFIMLMTTQFLHYAHCLPQNTVAFVAILYTSYIASYDQSCVAKAFITRHLLIRDYKWPLCVSDVD